MLIALDATKKDSNRYNFIYGTFIMRVNYMRQAQSLIAFILAGNLTYLIFILFITVLLYPTHTLSETKTKEQKVAIDSSPTILVLPEAPQQTDQEQITLEIQINDPDGIQDYWVKVNGVKLLPTHPANNINNTAQPEVRFSIDITLVIGPNLISIHAIDQFGYSNLKEIRIFSGEDKNDSLDHTLRRSLYYLLKRAMQSL